MTPRFFLLTTALLIVGCATPPSPGPTNYVVLLPEANGSVGKVFVKGAKGEHTLDVAGMAGFVNGQGEPFMVSPEQLQRDFGPAMGARPLAPEQFYLYFESGGVRLTPESQALVTTLLARIAERDNPDVSVIGHSDTTGKAEANAVLAYQRAASIANMLREKGMQPASLRIESHGESNLLVPTPDETAEPLNRRVEITVR